jgi:hypothetical protein
MNIINKLTVGGLILGTMAAGTNRANAGETEWATVGKVLTGVVVASAVHQTIHQGGQVTLVIGTPPPPQRVFVAPPRVVVAQPPIIVAPRPRPYCGPVVMHRPVLVPRPVYTTCAQPFHPVKKRKGFPGRGHSGGHGKKRGR